MDHQEAARIQAPERYLLGQLTAPEQEAFEEHFFVCTECAEEVRTGAVFAANARSVFRDQARRPTAVSPAVRPQTGSGWWGWLSPAWSPAGGLSLSRSRSWLQAVPALAAGLLLCVVGYDQAVIRRLTQPRSNYDVLAKTGTKGSPGDAVVIPRDEPFFTVYFIPDVPKEHEEYVCDIESVKGKRIVSSVPIKRHGSHFSILLKRSDFADGDYDLILRRTDSQAAPATYHFQVTSHY
jgi:hypothetical protein